MDLNEYFSKIWKSDMQKYTFSGYRILSQLSPGSKVLDVGCGNNLFKDILKDDLLGIDPYNHNSDIKISIEDFETSDKFDAALCLGSINFGDAETILSQIIKVKSLLKDKGKIFWRQNPGLADHGNEYCKDIHFFEWSFVKNQIYAEELGFDILELRWDSHNRIYSVWQLK